MNEYNGNIGFLFSKIFFEKPHYRVENGKEKVTFQNLSIHTNTLQKQVFLNNYSTPENLGNCQFELVTTYPGLLVGSGYSHDIHDEQGLKLGFYFDHTTGLPHIPGSSVKGVLKSAFEKVKGEYILCIIEEIKTEKRKLFDEKNLEGFNNLNADSGIITNWVKTIFDGIDGDGKNIPVTQKDIFFDAYPLESGNENSRFLATDYITPHSNPLKNPIPIQFLKVLPQVKFRFDFRLTDNGITAPLKNELFRQILLDLGIGAKTNVGYGQFMVNYFGSDKANIRRKKRQEKKLGFEENISTQDREKLRFNEFHPDSNLHKGVISDISDEEYLINLFKDCFLVKSKKAVISKFEKDGKKKAAKGKPSRYKKLKKGDEVTIRINKPTKLDDINFTIMPIWLP